LKKIKGATMMNELTIGVNIAMLRKERGITQETLAESVGVSGQAVSKWESGGSPDTAMLPIIADYFGVSIDRLYGRKTKDYKSLEHEIAESITMLPNHKTQLDKIYDYCWAMQRAMFGEVETPALDEMEEISTDGDSGCTHSGIVQEDGLTIMGLTKSLRYFLIMPRPADGWAKRLYFKPEYVELFKSLSDENFLKTLFFLYTRKVKPFTPLLLERELNIPVEQGAAVLDKLAFYKFVFANEIDIDNEIRTIYEFCPYHPSFVAFLNFAEEIIKPPGAWYGYLGTGGSPPLLA